MSETLCDLIAAQQAKQFATQCGTRMHDSLQKITIDGENICGDAALAEKISGIDGAADYFSPRARTEVPVAGTINGVFVSRRIDRMIINDAQKIIRILDYKTDIDKSARRTKYQAQLREYCDLLRIIYPGYKICASILWTHDWQLENL